jgi:polyisoprenoid-binding protein YceI
MKTTLRLLILLTLAITSVCAADSRKLTTQTGRIIFTSTTALTRFSAENNSVVSVLVPASGEIGFVVPMQGFVFEKALMQQHFNQAEYLDTKTYPRATFKGRITNLAALDFTKDGTYPAIITGTLAIKGVEKTITQSGTLKVKGDTVVAESSFDLSIADFGLTFTNGKVAGKIAGAVQITVKIDYTPAM